MGLQVTGEVWPAGEGGGVGLQVRGEVWPAGEGGGVGLQVRGEVWTFRYECDEKRVCPCGVSLWFGPCGVVLCLGLGCIGSTHTYIITISK